MAAELDVPIRTAMAVRRVVLHGENVADLGFDGAGFEEVDGAGVVGPDALPYADDAVGAELACAPFLWLLDDRFRGDGGGADHDVNVVGSDGEGKEIPAAEPAVIADCRIHEDAGGGREDERRVGHPFTGTIKSVRIRAEAGSAEGVVAAVNGARIIAVEPGAVGVPGEEVAGGEDRHGRSVQVCTVRLKGGRHESGAAR